MEFIKKYKFVLLAIILALIVGKVFIKGTVTLEKLMETEDPKKVTLYYEKYADKNSSITDLEKIKELKESLSKIELRQKGRSAVVNDKYNYEFTLDFNDGLKLFFRNHKNLEVIYVDEKTGEKKLQDYRILRGVDRDLIFSLFGLKNNVPI